MKLIPTWASGPEPDTLIPLGDVLLLLLLLVLLLFA